MAVVGHPVEVMKHGIGEVLGDEKHQEPADPPADDVDDAALPVRGGIGLGVGGDAAELEDVLGLFLAEDVHGVVVGDDADEHVVESTIGNGEQVVLVDLAGDGLLVFVDPAEDDVALHDVFDQGRTGARGSAS